MGTTSNTERNKRNKGRKSGKDFDTRCQREQPGVEDQQKIKSLGKKKEEKCKGGRTVRPMRLMATSTAFLSTALPLRSLRCEGGWRAGNERCVRCLGGCRKGGGTAGGLSRVPSSPQESTSQGLSFKIAFASLALSSLKRPEPLEPVSAERLRWGERPRDCATGVGGLREAVDGPGADAGGGIQDSSELASDGRGE